MRLFALLLTLTTAVSFGDEPAANPAQANKDRTIVETLLRLPSVDVNSQVAWKAAVIRHLETVKGTPKYVELVEKLKLRGVEDELYRLAMEDSASTHGARAAALIVRIGEGARFEQAAGGADEKVALQAVTALGNVGNETALRVLEPLVTKPNVAGSVRVAAARAIGKNLNGQRFLLNLVESGQLPGDLKFTAADVLLGSTDGAIRTAAGKHLTLPAGANSQPLPPIAELVKMKGDAASGRKLFETTATCAKCHKVQGAGKDVGPDLSEIGSKLARDACFLSILDPSAGISHNYESYVAVTTDGLVLTGILVSRTDQSVTLRNAEAIDKEIPLAEIDELQKSATSLMPADLQKTLSVQDLVDVVEYLMTLKKAS